MGISYIAYSRICMTIQILEETLTSISDTLHIDGGSNQRFMDDEVNLFKE